MKKACLTLTALLTLATVVSTALARDFWLDPYFWPDPHVEAYLSGGPDRIDGCPGYVARQPDHIMFLSDDFSYLRLFVESGGADTTLILHQPSSGDTFCDDDSYGDRQPQIVMDYITAGEWHVYVGSFWPDEVHPYELHVTEFRPQTATPPRQGSRPWFTSW